MNQAIKTVIITLMLAGTSYGITYRDDVSRKKFVDFGSKHKCVVRIVANVSNSKYKTSGSGVIIGPHIVLTAAHVMTSVEDSRVIVGDKEYPISAAVCPNSYKTNKFGYGDLAVCYTKSVLPQEFYVKLYGESDEIGKICSIAGWGRSGTFASGHKSTPRQRLAGSNKIDSLDRHMLLVSPTQPRQSGMTTLECIVSPGDSGGGMFIDGKLAGIHSVLITDLKGATHSMLTGGYHCYSGSTRISKFKPWIEKTADELVNFYKLTENINNALGYNAKT
jgi:hypothetical protein